MAEPGFVYILASKRNGTLYLGSTNNLARRIGQHRCRAVEGFSKRYGCELLVWYEAHDDLFAARRREYQMKEWRRAWKLREIEGMNPDWADLFDQIAQG